MNYKPAVLPPEELLDPGTDAFCRAHGLAAFLGEVKSLARKYFPDSPPISFQLEEDPEDGVEYLEVTLAAPGDIRLASERYDRFTDEWVAKAPPSVREKIRFDYKVG